MVQVTLSTLMYGYNSSLVLQNLTQDVKSFEHCHSYAIGEKVYFYGNVLSLAVIISLGLVGNSVMAAVYCMDRVKNSSTILLQALPILDNILLIGGLFSTVLHSAFPYTGAGHWLWDNKGFFTLIAKPITQWAHTCSTWCMVLVTVDRYIVASRPLKAPKLCTVKRAKYSIVFLTTFCFLYTMPKAFEVKIAQVTDRCSNETVWKLEKTEVMNNGAYKLGYTVVLYFIVIYIVPLAILIVLNGLLIKHIKKATYQRQVLTNKPKLLKKTSSIKQMLIEDGITRTVVCVILRFIVCTTPALALQILILTDDPVKDTYQVFSNLLVYLNSSTNFIIFAVMGTRFRKVLCARLCKTKKEQRKLAQRNKLASFELLRNISILSMHTTDISMKSESNSSTAGMSTVNELKGSISDSLLLQHKLNILERIKQRTIISLHPRAKTLSLISYVDETNYMSSKRSYEVTDNTCQLLSAKRIPQLHCRYNSLKLDT